MRRAHLPAAAPALAAEPGREAEAVMDALRRIVRALRASSHESERSLGVSAAQLFVLRQLALAPRQSLSELAARARTTQSSVSEVVARLVAAGLVARSPAALDRRRAELTLTARGRDVLARSAETVQERLLAGFARLDAGQQRALAAGLEAWLATAGLADVPATMFLEP